MNRTRVAYAADAMALPDEYERQQRWRRFGDALTHAPLVRGQRVLDVGCGVGTASVLLARAGADVVGVDVDDALLLRARELHPALRFEKHDVGELDVSTLGRVDGIWASFVAAYFPDLSPFVTRLRELLVDEGWIALVEIDDLLGHEPRAASLAADIAGFCAWARAQGGYGFLHGRALAPALRDAGFELVYEGTLDDGELAFRGPAPADVLDAWRSRFARMGGMRTYFGERFDAVSGEILAALQARSHRSLVASTSSLRAGDGPLCAAITIHNEHSGLPPSPSASPSSFEARRRRVLAAATRAGGRALTLCTVREREVKRCVERGRPTAFSEVRCASSRQPRAASDLRSRHRSGAWPRPRRALGRWRARATRRLNRADYPGQFSPGSSRSRRFGVETPRPFGRRASSIDHMMRPRRIGLAAGGRADPELSSRCLRR